MRFLTGSRRRRSDERLLWSRDMRFAHRLTRVPARDPELRARRRDRRHRPGRRADRRLRRGGRGRQPERRVRPRDPRPERCPRASATSSALSSAVQQSGLADRIGMAQSSQVDPDEDARLLLQPQERPRDRLPADRRAGDAASSIEYECLFRPADAGHPDLDQRRSSQAAIDTGRTIELDAFIVRIILERAARAPGRRGGPAGQPPLPPRDQLHAGQPARPAVRGVGPR